MTRPTRSTIATCLRSLLKEKEAQYNRGYIRRSAFITIKSHVSTLSRFIGHRMVTELTNYDLEQFFNETLRDAEKCDGSIGYKDAAIKNFHNTLKQMFDSLERQGRLKQNPFAMKVRLYRLNDREPILPYTLDEIRSVMCVADGCGIVEGFFFACREGLRPCELIALTENNIFFGPVSTTIVIEKSIVLGEFNKPKTGKSQRHICITQASGDILVDMLSQPVERMEFELKGTQHQERFIFTNPETKSYWQSSQEYYKSLKYFFKKAEVQFRGIQPCRHTYATTAIDSGMKIVDVANHLGHSSVDTTMRHYRDIKGAVLGRQTLAFREENDPFKNLTFNPVRLLIAA